MKTGDAEVLVFLARQPIEGPTEDTPSAVWAKGEVLKHLWEAKRISGTTIVTQSEIQAAIANLGLSLGVGNPANFLKDIIRRPVANALWPVELKRERITARQRFGQKRVLEFIPYAPDQSEPFPDRFEPRESTPLFFIQSISLPSAARRLGREDETWLAQIMVNLRIVEALLAFGSNELASRLRDIVHLQIGMKTQPEIDATFIITAMPEQPGGEEEHIFVTCEVKKKAERLLEDQIRFQIHQGFKSTAALRSPTVSAVKPVAIRIVNRSEGDALERVVYAVEFKTIMRQQYEQNWQPLPGVRRPGQQRGPRDDTPVYGIPLERESDAFFRVVPPVQGISHG